MTEEHSISIDRGRFATGYRFSEQGDSGAFIFDNRRQVIGLLFAGCDEKNATYFTHILDVFDDIKAVTGAVDVRIMGSMGF